MPQVNIQVIGKAPTEVQKKAVFAEITDLMVDVLGPTRKLVVVSLSASPASIGQQAARIRPETDLSARKP